MMRAAPEQLEVVILVGLQASGKTTFYRSRLAQTHVHVSKDLHRNARNKARRQREEIDAALGAGQNVAVDNTNLSRADRAPIVEQARAWNARVICYYFESNLEGCLARNAQREGRARVPEVAIRAFRGRLEVPSSEEGFDALWYVKLGGEGGFAVQASCDRGTVE